MRSVSSLVWVGLLQEMIVVQGFPLNIATIILGCIFSMLLSDFRLRGLRCILTLPSIALTEVFHADAEINIDPLSVSGYFISNSLCGLDTRFE